MHTLPSCSGRRADFRQIMGEESGHVAWGCGLRARIERENPTLFRIIEHYETEQNHEAAARQ